MPKKINDVAIVSVDTKGKVGYKFDSRKLEKEIEKAVEKCILKNMPSVRKV